jgi:hypothetical protein
MRLLLLAVFAVLPLLAGAHEGHRQAPAAQTALPVEANGAIVAVVSAPSRCPGGEENCCCPDLGCTSSYQPVALAAPASPNVIPSPARGELPLRQQAARRSIALARYSPRGPPPYS